MNPLEKIVQGGSTLQGKPLEGGDAHAKKPVAGGDTHAKKPVAGGSSCTKRVVGGSKSVGGDCGSCTGGKKKGKTAKKSKAGCGTAGGKKKKKKGGNGFLSHITIPALFVAANTMFGKKKTSKNKKRSPFTKKNRK